MQREDTMAELTGSEILARSLKNEGTDILFFLMGGPMLLAESSCIKEGIRPLDVRHEQSAALMGHAYSRLLQKPSVCMAASGPGVINLTTGIANALIDCAPVVAIGGSSPIGQFGRQVFQEIDQLAIMKPCTKWADRVYNLKRIPEQVNNAFQRAMLGKPGPVYLDFPGDILYAKIPEEQVDWSLSGRPLLGARPMGDERQVEALIDAIRKAQQPIILSGSGVIWSQAWAELTELVEESGIPFYTTPQGRGVLPDDHAYSYLTMRSTAFREADLIVVVGTRMNYIISHAAPPRFNAAAKIARIDIDADEIATAPRKVDIGIVGDCKTVLRQILNAANGHLDKDRFAAWRKKLADGETAKRMAPDANQPRDDVPIHPLRLCEEIKNFMQRDAILVVDGQEILNYGRQSMPTYVPGHRLNSGPFGTMGVGLPYGLGAKLAKPDKQVIVVHGDGSFGLNALELDTAVRHNIPILVVISLNGGWTADPAGNKPGRNLGYTRFDKMAETLGCYGDYVEEPAKIRPALDRAQREVDRGNVALVNVKTDHRARAGTLTFAQYST
jgi:thiamine pyrophosphate-dependent acetolactate synthase large subunit-like protein